LINRGAMRGEITADTLARLILWDWTRRWRAGHGPCA
jgi:hypothetical protein